MDIKQKTKQRELELWERYRYGDKEALGPLIISLDPLIQNQVDKFSKTPLPRNSIEAEARRLAVKALEDYDPNKAGLSTHVTNHMKHLQRFVSEYQNVGRIPENRSLAISKYLNLKTGLTEKLNREPTILELSDELAWSVSEVSRMEQELRNDLTMSPSASDEEDFFDADYNKTDETMEIVQFVYWDPTLSNEQRKLLEYKFGLGGQPRLEIKDIALRLGRSETYTRKLAADLADRIIKAQR